MKLRHYFAVAILAALIATLVQGPDPSGVFIKNRLLEQFMPTAYAQQVGFGGWNNIHMAFVNADFTDANASGQQNIPRLQWSLPANIAANYRIDCDINFSQATAAADSFGIQFSNAPTSAIMGGIMATNTTAFASITPPTITNTSATAVVTGTPAVTTVLYTHIGGFAEIPSNATDTVVNISVAQGTAANVIVTKRGSACMWHSMN